MINREARLAITRQCELLELSRWGVYYTPVPVSMKDIELMRQIDEINLLYTFYGSTSDLFHRYPLFCGRSYDGNHRNHYYH